MFKNLIFLSTALVVSSSAFADYQYYYCEATRQYYPATETCPQPWRVVTVSAPDAGAAQPATTTAAAPAAMVPGADAQSINPSLHVNCGLMSRFRDVSANDVAPDNGIYFGMKFMDWTPDIATYLKSVADGCEQRAIDEKNQWWQNFRQRDARIAPNPPAKDMESIHQEWQRSRNSIDTVMTLIDQKKKNIEAQKMVAQCRETPQSRMYEAERRVIDDYQSILADKKLLAEEHDIANISGVRNLANERLVGERIYSYTEDMKSSFAYYKKIGGKASTPAGVKYTLSAPPCN